MKTSNTRSARAWVRCLLALLSIQIATSNTETNSYCTVNLGQDTERSEDEECSDGSGCPEEPLLCQSAVKETRDSMNQLNTMETNQQTNAVSSSDLAIVPYEPPILARFHEEQKEFIFGEHRVRIKQDWDASGVAAVVWDAAVVLAEYLHRNEFLVKGKSILELGAGTGLAGIVAFKLGAAKTVLTDRESALDILRQNVLLNHAEDLHTSQQCTRVEHSDRPPLCSDDISVDALEWGSNLKEKYLQYDIILGADIIYIEETFSLLLKTLCDLTKNSKKQTVILLSCRIRYERDERFLGMLREHFIVKQEYYDKIRDIYVYTAIYNFET